MTIGNMDFANRIARINAGQGSSKNTLYVGVDQSFTIAPEKHHQFARAQENVKKSLQITPHVVAFFIGIMAHVIAASLIFQFIGMPAPEANPDVALGIGVGLGVFIVICLNAILRLKSGDHVMTSTVGIFVGICLMHNVVHLYPATFDILFSPEWTSQTLSVTDVGTAVFRGEVYTF